MQYIHTSFGEIMQAAAPQQSSRTFVPVTSMCF